VRAGLLAAICVARTASAAPCEADSASIRAHLTDEAQRAHRWNLVWGLGFGAAAVGQLALGIDPTHSLDRDLEQAAYVGAAKATVGALGHVVTPLVVEVPPPVPDACADLAALRAAAIRTAARERTTFWLNQIGALAVNATGAVVLGERTTWANAGESFALGYAVGLISTYTMPRGSWHAADAPPIAVGFTGGVVWIAGAF
jgi:hypothetical protein